MIYFSFNFKLGKYFDIAEQCWQFAAAPRGGLLLALGSRTPAADGEQRSKA